MNQVATIDQNQKKAPSLLTRMGQRFGVDENKLLTTLKNTAFKIKNGEATNEQMMALMVVADQHGLKKGEFLQHLSKDPGSLTQLVNDLVWWAVEVRAQELQE